MANKRVIDHKWHDIRYQELPDWVKSRVKELYRHELRGKTFIYRRDNRTRRYQRKLRDHLEVKLPYYQPKQATGAMLQYDQKEATGSSAARESLEESEIPPDTIVPSSLQTLVESAPGWFAEKGGTVLDKLLNKRTMSLAATWTVVWFLLAAWLYIKAHEVGRNFYLYSSIIAAFIGVIGLALLVIRLWLNRRIEKQRIEDGKAEIIDMIEDALKAKGEDKK